MIIFLFIFKTFVFFAGDGPHYRDICVEMGIIRLMLKFIDDTNVPRQFLQNVTWVIVNLCRHKQPVLAIEATQQLMPALKFLIGHQDSRVKNGKIFQTNCFYSNKFHFQVLTDAIWALSYITDMGCDQIQLVIDFGIVPYLVQFLGSTDNKLQV